MVQRTTDPQARFGFCMSTTTGEWVPVTDLDKVITWPFNDLDVAFTWDVNGKPTQIVITGFGKTKTMILTWAVEGTLTSIATVIT